MTRMLAVLFALITVVACDMAIPPGDARISGGVWPCQGLQMPGEPHYTAAKVTVLAGRVSWHQQPGNIEVVRVLPTQVVATQTVRDRGLFTFLLKPGHYVLDAQYLPLVEGAADAFTEVDLHRSDDLRVDIPDPCF